MDTKQKYVRIKQYNSVIIFSCIIEHSEFKKFDPISAGFCYINSTTNTVDCFGESFSLDLKSNPKEDSEFATKQIFGIEALLNMK